MTSPPSADTAMIDDSIIILYRKFVSQVVRRGVACYQMCKLPLLSGVDKGTG